MLIEALVDGPQNPVAIEPISGREADQKKYCTPSCTPFSVSSKPLSGFLPLL